MDSMLVEGIFIWLSVMSALAFQKNGFYIIVCFFLALAVGFAE